MVPSSRVARGSEAPALCNVSEPQAYVSLAVDDAGRQVRDLRDERLVIVALVDAGSLSGTWRPAAASCDSAGASIVLLIGMKRTGTALSP